MLDVKACLNDCEEMMEMAVMHLEEEFSHIRAGKAKVHILDCVRVNSYGSGDHTPKREAKFSPSSTWLP